MRASTDRILTTHVGALPIPPGLWSKEGVGEARLRREVAEIVRLQREAGVDIVNEGELTKGGNWVSFINQRLSGFVPVDNGATSALLMQSDRGQWIFAAQSSSRRSANRCSMTRPNERPALLRADLMVLTSEWRRGG